MEHWEELEALGRATSRQRERHTLMIMRNFFIISLWNAGMYHTVTIYNIPYCPNIPNTLSAYLEIDVRA